MAATADRRGVDRRMGAPGLGDPVQPDCEVKIELSISFFTLMIVEEVFLCDADRRRDTPLRGTRISS
jgi:hypothetical protein